MCMIENEMRTIYPETDREKEGRTSDKDTNNGDKVKMRRDC